MSHLDFTSDSWTQRWFSGRRLLRRPCCWCETLSDRNRLLWSTRKVPHTRVVSRSRVLVYVFYRCTTIRNRNLPYSIKRLVDERINTILLQPYRICVRFQSRSEYQRPWHTFLHTDTCIREKILVTPPTPELRVRPTNLGVTKSHFVILGIVGIVTRHNSDLFFTWYVSWIVSHSHGSHNRQQ